MDYDLHVRNMAIAKTNSFRERVICKTISIELDFFSFSKQTNLKMKKKYWYACKHSVIDSINQNERTLVNS